MSRPRRTLDNEGRLHCPACDELKFIEEFYVANGPIWYSVDFPDETVHYGRPSTYCKTCTKQHRTGKTNDKGPKPVRVGMTRAQIQARELIRLREEAYAEEIATANEVARERERWSRVHGEAPPRKKIVPSGDPKGGIPDDVWEQAVALGMVSETDD